MRGLNFDPPPQEDAEWFNENVAPLLPDLRAFSREISNKQDFVEEAFQDALITLWAFGRERHDPDLRPVWEDARAAVWGWIQNNRKERKRAREGREVVTDPFELPPARDVYAGTHHVESIIAKAGDSDRRTLLFMYHVQRLSQAEIARREGISQQAVAKRLRLAHRELQAAAQDWL